MYCGVFFFSSRRRHTRWPRDWSSDVCSSDLAGDATVANGNSSITLTDVEGSADVRGSFGEIRVIRVKKGAKVSSGNGRISDESLHGKIGDGRCELTLTDNNGTIDLLKGR